MKFTAIIILVVCMLAAIFTGPESQALANRRYKGELYNGYHIDREEEMLSLCNY